MNKEYCPNCRYPLSLDNPERAECFKCGLVVDFTEIVQMLRQMFKEARNDGSLATS